MSDSVSYEFVQEAQSPVGALVAADGGRTDLHIGDYVGIERVSPLKEWKLSLGRVVGFPSTRTVKVAHYDAQNSSSVALDPKSERKIKEVAETQGQMELWHNREALREELRLAMEKEKAASARFFEARDVTAQQQQAAGQEVAHMLETLDTSRNALRTVPPAEWKEVRNVKVPAAELACLVRSVMLVLYEDTASAWEDMQKVMRRADFMERLVSWDCTVTPMAVSRRRQIAGLCSGRKDSTKKRRRSTSRGPSVAHLGIPAKATARSIVPTFDVAIRLWLNAQLACSAAARAQENAVNDCFTEQQHQRVMLREVNDLRVNVSTLEQQMLTIKSTILGVDTRRQSIMPLDSYPTDVLFYKRTYPDSDGRFVQEVVLRESVVVNFGATTAEDTSGYVRLDGDQADRLRRAVITANVRHDADEMAELLTRKEREEEELAELADRVKELRGRRNLSADEEEELAQLEKLHADAQRRNHATLSRIADLYACGRGAREITLAIKRPAFRYTRLHCKMSGDWAAILNDRERYGELVSIFSADISNALNIPATNVLDVDARSGSLLIDFTVKHNGDLDDDELQDLVNRSTFPKLSLFYEKVTFKKTSPLNTSQQQESYEDAQRLGMPLPISGMGPRQILADYYNPDGTLDEEFSDAIRAHRNYRPCVITIPPVREDYNVATVNRMRELCAEDEETPDAAAAAASVARQQTGSTAWQGSHAPGSPEYPKTPGDASETLMAPDDASRPGQSPTSARSKEGVMSISMPSDGQREGSAAAAGAGAALTPGSVRSVSHPGGSEAAAPPSVRSSQGRNEEAPASARSASRNEEAAAEAASSEAAAGAGARADSPTATKSPKEGSRRSSTKATPMEDKAEL